MSLILEKIDDEFIFDQEHILMNYLKINHLNHDCFKGTNIQISPKLFSYPPNQDYIQNSLKFGNEYFGKLNSSPLALDLFSTFITSFPNSDLGLFLTILLKQNFIELSQDLNNSSELFQKYKKGILVIYHSVLPQQKHHKILENICSSIAVLIIIGFQGQWSSGIDQLISAAKQGDINSENNLIAALILANIEDIYSKLEEKLDNKSSKFILSLIDSYSSVIQDYINFLITKAFYGDKASFVNGELFKAFISILQSAKLFKINIIKIHGFLDFLMNCISYIDANDDFIVKIIEVFDIAFKYNNKELKFDYEKNFKMDNFIIFINAIIKNQDFLEIMNCIKLLQNMLNYYDFKKIKEISNNPKDIQILFASANIFNSILENFGYIFFIPDLDEIIQDIYNYFINIKMYKLNRILFSSLTDLFSLSENLTYKFDNYSQDIRQNKKEKFLSFLYSIQNSVLQNMALTNEELNSVNIDNDINTNKLISEAHQLDKYINILLKNGINNDDKTEFIENSDEFYNDIYDIICSLFNGKDYCDKLCTYLLSSTENKDFIIIDCLMNVYNFLSFKIINEYPDIIFNLIEFIFNKKDILFQNQRFVLQFSKLIFKESIQISKNKKILNLIINNLILFETSSEKFNQIAIVLINKLILSSYQCYKLNKDNFSDNDKLNQNKNEEKDLLNNIFNIISNYLMKKLLELDHIFLYKLIDAFYNSLFYTVALNINNIQSIITVSEKLIKEANQLLYMNNNINEENILKYIFIIWSITKNIGKENKDVLFNLFNKIESNNNNIQETYFINIQDKILKIIESNKNNNFNKNIINSVILLNNNLISLFKDKAVQYFDYFNQVISLILTMNQSFPKIYSLTLNLYNQILTYNINNDKYNDITKIGFDVLNSINIIYNSNKNKDDIIYLANKQTEFLILYLQKSSYFISKLTNNEIFIKSLDNILNIFEISNNKDFSINFINLIKLLIDFSGNNNDLRILLESKFIEKMLRIIISHIQYFDATYQKCIQNCFYIFVNCGNPPFEEKFCLVLKECFNEKQITEIIIKYLRFLSNNMSFKNNDKIIREFMEDLKTLIHGSNKIKYEFIEKYINKINNSGANNDNNNYQTIKINPNGQIYMDLYSK